MDQDTTGGTDKRNWRERLGIGTKEAAPKDMPRISEEFRPAPAAPRTATAAAGVKPAPMAPRIVARAPTAAVQAPRPAALAPDALANKLKSQRDAAEKLAEQRVLAARNRAEAAMAATKLAATPAASPAAKPKFTFADDDAKTGNLPSVMRPAAPPVRPASALPPAQNGAPAYVPQMAPPRLQLGGTAPIPQQRIPAPQQAYPQGQPYGQQQQPYVPQNPSQGYAPPPAYRPIDPATGYAPPPPYNPPPRQTYGAQPGQQQPRLQVPQRGQSAEYAPVGYDQQRQNPRLTNNGLVRTPIQQDYADAEDDIFEKPAPQRNQRRATANDYQQAYREVESGYEDEPSRSNVPWILAGLLFLVLAGFGSIWAYSNYLKPNLAATSGQTVPVVKAPEQATKVSPDATAEVPAAAPGQAAQPTKKQIYDRIIGDREVLGGELVPTEQTPVQPETNSQAVPAPADPVVVPAAGTGADGTPLPLPPPPGATGDGTQGSLEPDVKSDQQIANITPAAGASPAANLPLEVPVAPAPIVETVNKVATAIEAPKAVAITPTETTPTPAEPVIKLTPEASETIQDTPVVEAKPAPVVVKKLKPTDAKKTVAAATQQKSLGAKPVILVPPAKQVSIDEAVPEAGGGIYGNDPIGQPTTVAQDTPVVAPAPVKKRRSLLDLFKKDTTTTDAAADNVVVQESQPELLPETKPAQKVAAAKPLVVEPTPKASGAYVAQLASFKSKAEASQEYSRMRSKHGAIVGRYAPIISEAQVAGTTRYRLNIGPMASSNVASSLCQSLFAAGERDCLVRRQ